MARDITQKITFKNTTTKVLYDLYTNAKKHSVSTGAIAEITAKEGTAFTAYDGYITGVNLRLIKDKLIVQSWRGTDWKENDVDSTFIIHLEQKDNDVILSAIHANLPDEQAEGIDSGWHEFYWRPWKKYLAGLK